MELMNKFVTCFFFGVLLCDLQTTEAVYQQVLSKALFDNLTASYDSSLLPICTDGANVTLRLDFALLNLLDVNEREQIIKTSSWIRMKWNDCRLAWNPASYNGKSYITVHYRNIWLPDLTLYESATEEMFPGMSIYRPTIYSDGSIFFNFPALITSTCSINVKYFPFDTQTCPFKFGSWAYHGYDLDVIFKNPKGDLTNFNENSEWVVDRIDTERHILFYGCCPEPYPDVTYYLILTRRPTFAVLTMIFPCMLTAAMAALGFILPAESGEKVSLEITVLLSLAVFLLLVSESLPPASDNFPVIGSYFAASMAIVSLSLAQSVIILNVYHKGSDGRRISRCAKRFFLFYVAKALCMRTINNESVEPIKKDSENAAISDDAVISEWHQLSNVLDRLFLIAYLTTSTITMITLLLQCVYKY